MNADKCVLLCSGSADPSLWHRVGAARVREVLLEEENGLSITALILLDVPVWLGWAEQLCAQQGCRAGQAGPPALLHRAGSLHQPLPPPLCRDTHTLLSKQLCDQALKGKREEPFHPARLQ